MRDVKAERIQCDEIWSFCYAKPRTSRGEGCPGGRWRRVDVDRARRRNEADRLLASSATVAAIKRLDLADDLAAGSPAASRSPPTATAPICRASGGSVRRRRGLRHIDEDLRRSGGRPGRYSPPVCVGAKKTPSTGKPDKAHVSTSYVERANLSIRMQNRRFTRLTNAFSKKLDNHVHALALYFAFYNFCRIHKTPEGHPCDGRGYHRPLWSLEDIVAKIDARRPRPGKRGPYKGRVRENTCA